LDHKMKQPKKSRTKKAFPPKSVEQSEEANGPRGSSSPEDFELELPYSGAEKCGSRQIDESQNQAEFEEQLLADANARMEAVKDEAIRQTTSPEAPDDQGWGVPDWQNADA